MEGMDQYESHPARDVSLASMRAVEAGDREAWLALFTDDAHVEDPIGPSMFDERGEGHRGRDAIAAFYDTVVSMGQISFAIRESYACGDECANVGRITTTFPDGSQAVVDGVYTYRTDGAGKVKALRAYWESANVAFVPAPSA